VQLQAIVPRALVMQHTATIRAVVFMLTWKRRANTQKTVQIVDTVAWKLVIITRVDANLLATALATTSVRAKRTKSPYAMDLAGAHAFPSGIGALTMGQLSDARTVVIAKTKHV